MEERYRTYPSKGFVIALIVTFVVSIAMFIGFIFIQESLWFKVFVMIFFGIFIVGSLIVLLDQTTHYVEVSGNDFIKHLLFIKKKISIDDIVKIELKNGFFEVYVKDKKFTYFSSDTNDGKKIIKYLDSKRVNIKW